VLLTFRQTANKFSIFLEYLKRVETLLFKAFKGFRVDPGTMALCPSLAAPLAGEASRLFC